MSKLSVRQSGQLAKVIFAMNMTAMDKDIVYERFLFLLSNLEEDEIELILDLTKRFRKLGINDYFSILPAAQKMAAARGSFKELIIAPLKKIAKPDPNVETDSSCCLYYLFKDLTQPLVSADNILFCDNRMKVFDLLKANPSTCILLVDDYIGTGETAKGAIDFLVAAGINVPRIFVLSIVCHEIGRKYLSKDIAGPFYGELVNRGISDYYPTKDEVDTRIECMKRIEKKLKIDQEYQLGYGECEGLLSLIRTPDNTFPIYWWTTSKDKKCSLEKRAPFERKREA